MNQAKKQTEQHLIDKDGQQLLHAQLPRHWRLREYRPDYGLDYGLELFAEPTMTEKGSSTYETLGEHIFIQLKSVRDPVKGPLALYSRGNVEKQKEVLEKSSLVGTLDTIRFPLEVSELVTVERMGVGVPVLLVVADLSCEKCSFVCLNDYIDKILVPRHEDYKSKASRTIHVPIANDIALEFGQTAIRWYGKRAKLYAAFQRFAFQAAELGDELSSPNTAQMAEYFATRIASYDFWNNTEMWGLIGYYGDALKRFLISGTPGIVKIDLEAVRHYANGKKERESEVLAELRNQEVLQLWRFLSVLPRNYEDVCREWFLPTALGFTCSYK